jgi:hypothetical protein
MSTNEQRTRWIAFMGTLGFRGPVLAQDAVKAALPFAASEVALALQSRPPSPELVEAESIFREDVRFERFNDYHPRTNHKMASAIAAELLRLRASLARAEERADQATAMLRGLRDAQARYGQAFDRILDGEEGSRCAATQAFAGVGRACNAADAFLAGQPAMPAAPLVESAEVCGEYLHLKIRKTPGRPTTYRCDSEAQARAIRARLLGLGEGG